MNLVSIQGDNGTRGGFGLPGTKGMKGVKGDKGEKGMMGDEGQKGTRGRVGKSHTILVVLYTEFVFDFFQVILDHLGLMVLMEIREQKE